MRFREKDPTTYYKSYYERNKERQREKFLKRTYGITVTEYNRLTIVQNNRCAICKTDADIRLATKIGERKKFRLAIDHNHETGQVRALLCNRCNMFVGHIENNRELLPVVLQYLEDH